MISAQSDQIIVVPPVKDMRGARSLTEETSQYNSQAQNTTKAKPLELLIHSERAQS